MVHVELIRDGLKVQPSLRTHRVDRAMAAQLAFLAIGLKCGLPAPPVPCLKIVQPALRTLRTQWLPRRNEESRSNQGGESSQDAGSSTYQQRRSRRRAGPDLLAFEIPPFDPILEKQARHEIHPACVEEPASGSEVRP